MPLALFFVAPLSALLVDPAPLSRRSAIVSAAVASAGTATSAWAAEEAPTRDDRTEYRIAVGPAPAPTAAISNAELYQVVPDSSKSLSPRVKPLSPKEIVRTLSDKRAVFLGEHHNSPADHILQAGVIREVHATSPKGRPIAVGLEAVQRRFQPVLDDYVAGRITEEQLEAATEWRQRWFWPFPSV